MRPGGPASQASGDLKKNRRRWRWRYPSALPTFFTKDKEHQVVLVSRVPWKKKAAMTWQDRSPDWCQNIIHSPHGSKIRRITGRISCSIRYHRFHNDLLTSDDWESCILNGKKFTSSTLQETNVSHLGERKSSSNMPYQGDMLIPSKGNLWEQAGRFIIFGHQVPYLPPSSSSDTPKHHSLKVDRPSTWTIVKRWTKHSPTSLMLTTVWSRTRMTIWTISILVLEFVILEFRCPDPEAEIYRKLGGRDCRVEEGRG